MIDKNKGTEPDFSLNDFRKWIGKQKFESAKNSRFKGHIVESKLSLKRTITKIDVDQGDLQEMAKDFRRNGGTILECDSNNILLVEVRSGTFRIPKYFVNIISNLNDES